LTTKVFFNDDHKVQIIIATDKSLLSSETNRT